MDVAVESTSRFCAYCNIINTNVTETTGGGRSSVAGGSDSGDD